MRAASPPAWRPFGLAPTSIQGMLQAALLEGAAATPVGAALAPVPGMANWGGADWGPPPSPPPPVDARALLVKGAGGGSDTVAVSTVYTR